VPELQHEDPAIRAAAVRALARAGKRERLRDCLDDEDPDVRLLAVQRVGGDDVIALLIRALADPHAGIRRDTAGRLWEARPSSVPALTEALGDANPRVRAGAALALSNFVRWKKDVRELKSDEAERVAPPLCLLLKDPDAEVRRNAARALHGLKLEGALERAVLAALTAALKDSDTAVRHNATLALRGWKLEGPQEGALVAALTEALKDLDPSVREAASWGLAQRGRVPNPKDPGKEAKP
jgi:HEAT repeat protein